MHTQQVAFCAFGAAEAEPFLESTCHAYPPGQGPTLHNQSEGTVSDRNAVVKSCARLNYRPVVKSCARLNYRPVRAFEQYVHRKEYKRKEAIRRKSGTQQWTPMQRSLSTEYCRTYVSRFFKCAEVNWTWKGSSFLSPLFEQHMRTMERDIVAAANSAKKSLTARHRWPNITRAEQSAIKQLREFDVGYSGDCG